MKTFFLQAVVWTRQARRARGPAASPMSGGLRQVPTLAKAPWTWLGLMTLMLCGCDTVRDAMNMGKEGFSIMVGQGGKTTAMTEISLDLKYQARAVAFDEPSPAWQLPLFAAEVDDLVPLNNGRILVSVLDLVQNFGLPVNGPYVLMEAGTGRELWRYERSKNRDNAYDFVCEGSALVVVKLGKRSLSYIGLDPQQGRELWQHNFDLPVRAAVQPASGVLAVAQLSSKQAELVALRVADGAVLWKAAEEVAAGDPVPELMVSNDAILSIGRRVSCYAADGKIVWKLDGIGPVAVNSLPVEGSDGFYVPTSGNAVTKISKEGKVLWTTPFGAPLFQLRPEGDRLYVHLAQTNQTTLAAVQSQSGTVLWKESFDDTILSRLAVSRDRIAYVAGGDIVGGIEVRDALSGRRLISAGGLRSGELPPHVVLYDDHVVAGSEYSVEAVSLKDGKILWDHKIETSKDEFYRLSNARSEYESTVESKQKKGAKAAPAVARSSQPGSFTKWAIRNDERVRANPSASHLEKMNAASAVQTSVRINSSMARMQSSIDMFCLSLEMQTVAANTVEAMADEAKMGRLLALINLTPKYHFNAIQGDYYIRPFAIYEDRYGLLIIDMRDGSWSEVTTCPYDLIFSTWGMQTQLPNVTAKGRLLVRGIGVDPSQWKEYIRWNRRLPSPAILAYDLKGLNFKKAHQFDQALQKRYTHVLEASPYYIRKGDRVVTVEAVECLRFNPSRTEVWPPGTKLVALKDQRSFLGITVNVQKEGEEDDKDLSVSKVRKLDAPWPPDFVAGEQLMLVVSSLDIRPPPSEKPGKGNYSFANRPQRGDMLTVVGLAEEGRRIRVTTTNGVEWLVPFTDAVRVNPPKAK